MIDFKFPLKIADGPTDDIYTIASKKGLLAYGLNPLVARVYELTFFKSSSTVLAFINIDEFALYYDPDNILSFERIVYLDNHFYTREEQYQSFSENRLKPVLNFIESKTGKQAFTIDQVKSLSNND